jgi:hypothetical protein
VHARRSSFSPEGVSPGNPETAATPEILFREVNERIAELTEAFMEGGAKLFVCECGRLDCSEPLELTLDEFEAIRDHASRFVVVPGHELEGQELVVEWTSRFVVVEKLKGQLTFEQGG